MGLPRKKYNFRGQNQTGQERELGFRLCFQVVLRYFSFEKGFFFEIQFLLLRFFSTVRNIFKEFTLLSLLEFKGLSLNGLLFFRESVLQTYYSSDIVLIRGR